MIRGGKCKPLVFLSFVVNIGMLLEVKFCNGKK